MRFVRLTVLTIAAALLAAAPAAAQELVATPRILNGAAPTRDWPAMTSVRFTTSSGKAYLCGGTLLGARWVLTAGHCATDVNGSVLPAGAFALRVGSTRRDEDGTAVLVTEVIRHPNYDATNPGAPTNDLALLHLASAVPQQPLRLIAPGAPEAAGWGAGAQATIIGWGITKSGDPNEATSLREAQVAMVGDGSCARAWPAFSSASMVCAGGGSTDTCLGDSGAPLMVSSSGGFELVGVAAFGTYPCAERDVPGVYTRVGAPTLNAWIRSYIEPSLFALPQPPTPQAPLPRIELPQESQSEPSIPDAPIGTVAVPLRHGTVAVPERVKLSTLRGKSLQVRFECERACTISGRLTLDARSARRFGLGNGRKAVTIGRGSSSLAEAGSRMLTVTLTAKAKRALRNRSRVSPRLRTDLRSGTERLASTQQIAASR